MTYPKIINNGASANDSTGDTIRNAFGKVNDNFTDLYTKLGSFQITTVPTHSYGQTGDVAGMVAFDSNYIYYCNLTYVDTSTNIWVRAAWSGTTW